MRRQRALIIGLLAFGLLFAGCGRRRAIRPPTGRVPPQEQVEKQRQQEEAGPPRSPTSLRMEKPSVKVSDPKGRWTFEAQAETMTAAAQQGPYTMHRASGRYERKGEPPVRMRADEIIVDKGAKRVTLIGSVHLQSPAMQVEGQRIEYNLDTQGFRAQGPTKWTYTRTPVAMAPPP